jgi:HEAT repeat protein
MASPAFERFRFSFFDDPYSARDGLDTAALAELQDDERAQAEEMLLAYLPDTRGVIGLGELRSREAERPLMELFETERRVRGSPAIVDLAKALWQIRPDPRWLATVTEVLASAAFDLQRMNAAMALAVFHHPEAVQPLVQALDDPAGLVRHHAARALLAIHGLLDKNGLEQHDREHMIYRVMADDPARRSGGKRDILAVIAGRPITGCR